MSPQMFSMCNKTHSFLFLHNEIVLALDTWMCEYVGARADGWTNERMDRWMYGELDIWSDGDKWMDRQMDRWMFYNLPFHLTVGHYFTDFG